MRRSELPSLRVCIPISPENFIPLPTWLSFGLRRELLEHLFHSFVEVLFILLGLVGHHVFGTAAPDQLLSFCVVQINHEGSLFVVLLRRGGLAYPSESPPTPSPAQTVVESLKRPLGV